MRPHNFHFILSRRLQAWPNPARDTFFFIFYFTTGSVSRGLPRLALSSTRSEVGLELHVSAS